MEIKVADVAELVDARDLKSLDGNVVWVRVPPPAPRIGKPAGRSDMSDTDDDFFGDDGAYGVDEFNRLSKILFGRVADFADEEDVDDQVIPALLLQLAVTMR